MRCWKSCIEVNIVLRLSRWFSKSNQVLDIKNRGGGSGGGTETRGDGAEFIFLYDLRVRRWDWNGGIFMRKQFSWRLCAPQRRPSSSRTPGRCGGSSRWAARQQQPQTCIDAQRLWFSLCPSLVFSCTLLLHFFLPFPLKMQRIWFPWKKMTRMDSHSLFVEILKVRLLPEKKRSRGSPHVLPNRFSLIWVSFVLEIEPNSYKTIRYISFWKKIAQLHRAGGQEIERTLFWSNLFGTTLQNTLSIHWRRHTVPDNTERSVLPRPASSPHLTRWEKKVLHPLSFTPAAATDNTSSIRVCWVKGGPRINGNASTQCCCLLSVRDNADGGSCEGQI